MGINQYQATTDNNIVNNNEPRKELFSEFQDKSVRKQNSATLEVLVMTVSQELMRDYLIILKTMYWGNSCLITDD